MLRIDLELGLIKFVNVLTNVCNVAIYAVAMVMTAIWYVSNQVLVAMNTHVL